MNEIYKSDIIKKYWERVDIKSGNECWGWKSYRHSFGYGVLSYRHRYFEFAHRVSWEIHNGEIPKGLCVLHSCDNPECTNPKHLFLGTKGDNNKDMTKKGRNGHKKSNGKGYKLSKTAIEFIRSTYDHKANNLEYLAGLFNVSIGTIHYWLKHNLQEQED